MYGILIWFIELFCCFLFLGNFYDKRQEKKRTLLFMMITVTLYYPFQFLLYNYFPFSSSTLLLVARYLSTCLYCFVVTQLFYKGAFCLKTLLLSSIYIGILAAIDFFSLITVFVLPQALFSIPEQYFPILYASAGVISKLLLFLTMQLTKRIIDQQSMNYVSKSQWLFATFMSVCTFSVTGLAGSIDADVPDEIIPMVFIAAIALLVLTAILFFNMCDLASKSRKLHEESPAPTSDHRAAPDVSAHHGGYRAVEKDILFVYQLGALSELSLEP